MPLKVTCSACGKVFKLGRPYPAPGSELQCDCGRVLVLSFPQGLITELSKRGPVFEETSPRAEQLERADSTFPYPSESKK